MGIKIAGIDLAAVVQRDIAPLLPGDITLISITQGTRTDGAPAGGRNPTRTSYPGCRGLAVENTGQVVAGELVAKDDALVLITANSIAGGSVVPKANDEITYPFAGAMRTRLVKRVGDGGGQAAWLCVVQG